MRRLAWLAACVAPACSLLAPTDSELSEDYGRPIVPADAGGDADALLSDAADGDACPGQKSCAGQCVDLDDPAYGCGATSCAPCGLDQASARCESGECRVDQCVIGHLDENRTDSDGCEFTSPIPTQSLTLWLAADAGIEETSGKITAWRDRSSMRHDHTQSDLVLRPSLLTATLNGKPAVRFGGQRLTSDDFRASFASGFTFVAVVRREATMAMSAQWAAMLDIFNDLRNSGIFFGRYGNADDLVVGYVGAPGRIRTTDGSFSPSVPHLISLVVDGSGATLRMDGQVPMVQDDGLVAVPQTPSHSFLGGNSGGSSFYDGWIAEIVLYEAPLGDVSVVEQYLKQKYGI